MSGDSPDRPERRILALIMPDLLLELALRKRVSADGGAESPKLTPLGVVVLQELERPAPVQLSLTAAGKSLVETAAELPSTQPLAAANLAAQRFGVRAGQSIAEASALVSQLVGVSR